MWEAEHTTITLPSCQRWSQKSCLKPALFEEEVVEGLRSHALEACFKACPVSMLLRTSPLLQPSTDGNLYARKKGKPGCCLAAFLWAIKDLASLGHLFPVYGNGDSGLPGGVQKWLHTDLPSPCTVGSSQWNNWSSANVDARRSTHFWRTLKSKP